MCHHSGELSRKNRSLRFLWAEAFVRRGKKDAWPGDRMQARLGLYADHSVFMLRKRQAEKVPGCERALDLAGNPIWILREKRGDFLGFHGLGKQVALSVLALHGLKLFELTRGFDALGHNRNVEVAGQRHDRLNQGGWLTIVFHVPHKALVDL